MQSQAPNIFRVKNRVAGDNRNFQHRTFYRTGEHAFERMTFTVPEAERATVREYLNGLHDLWFRELHDSEGGTSTFLLSADTEDGYEQLVQVVAQFDEIALTPED